MNQYLKIFSCCHIIKGARRAAIYDTQRKNIEFIPLSLLNLIQLETNTINITKYRKELNGSSKEVFEDYILFLLEKEVGFLCDKEEIECFPQMNKDFIFPAYISNIIIDTKQPFIKYIDKEFLEQLEALCCNYIQIRYYNNVSRKDVQNLLNYLNSTQIKAIEIVLPYCMDEKGATSFIQNNRKVRSIIFTGAPYTKLIKKEDRLNGAIIFSETIVESYLHCGTVQSEQFALNITHYTESLHHNTCLNRKIAIDIDGNIKNCPSMKESFGNIRDTTLIEAVNKPGFKKYWNITKDQIIKCKDCEFRHICTDCRAYLDNPEDLYSAPLKCGYDPYTCEWEEWSTHPLKQTAIDHYGMRTIL